MKLNKDQKLVVQQIRCAERKTFASLVEIAGLNPRLDFRGANLSGVDFGATDLRGYDFTGADLSSANLIDASVSGAILTGADITGTRWSDRQFGPFHRIRSPTQTDWIAQLQQKTGMIADSAARGLAFRSVKAYRGSLPEGKHGIEFFTPYPPRTLNPSHVQWQEGKDEGVSTIWVRNEEFVAIPATVTKLSTPITAQDNFLFETDFQIVPTFANLVDFKIKVHSSQSGRLALEMFLHFIEERQSLVLDENPEGTGRHVMFRLAAGKCNVHYKMDGLRMFAKDKRPDRLLRLQTSSERTSIIADGWLIESTPKKSTNVPKSQLYKDSEEVSFSDFEVEFEDGIESGTIEFSISTSPAALFCTDFIMAGQNTVPSKMASVVVTQLLRKSFERQSNASHEPILYQAGDILLAKATLSVWKSGAESQDD